MESLKIADQSSTLSWDYDEDADVLYLSLGRALDPVGIDIGEGLIV